MELIKIDKDACNLCHACIRVCPVKAIEVKVNQDYARVVHSRCIGCGSCLNSCAQDAIAFESSIEQVREYFAKGEKVAAICAPSISGEFDDITDYRKFVEMIRALGFHFVNEVSFGVDLVAAEYARLIGDSRGKYYIMANCPAVVSYVEKFSPGLVENLAPLISPMVTTAQVVRKTFGEDIRVVHIGPCVAQKIEALRTTGPGRVDAVLTFTELRRMFAEQGIDEKKVENSDFDPPIGNKGSLYPLANGILQAAGISEDLLEGEVITIEGKQNLRPVLAEFEDNIINIRKHYNQWYCEGCLMGPGTSKNGRKNLRRTLVTDYAKKRVSSLDTEKWKHDVLSFRQLNFGRSFQADDQRLEKPTPEKIEEILLLIGHKNDNHGVGCEACGYTSCIEFATAVAQGLAKTDMCISYTLKNKQEYIQTLKVTNEKLAKMQESLQQSEKMARMEQQAAKDAFERTAGLLQKLPSAIIIVDEDLKIIDSNRSFIQLLGEDAEAIDEIIPGLIGADLKTLLPVTFYKLFSYVLANDDNIMNRDVSFGDQLLNVSIFTLKKNKIVGAVIRDLYVPEIRKEEVITRVSEVIDENLTLVQKIGFLLGEGAAKTEQMLNSIIQSYRSDKKTGA